MLSATLAREEGHVPCWLSLLGTSTSERAAAAAGLSVSEETGSYSEPDVGLALPILPSCGSHHLPSWCLALGKLPMNVSHKRTRSFKSVWWWRGTGETAQQLTALTALGEELGLILSTHMVAHSRL